MSLTTWLTGAGRMAPSAAAGAVAAALCLVLPLPSGTATNTILPTTSNGAVAAPAAGATSPGAPGVAAPAAGGPGALPSAAGPGGIAPPGAAPSSFAGAPSVGTGARTVNSSDATYQGVTANSVLWGFSAQDKGCGSFNQSAVAAEYGSSSNPSADYSVGLQFFNKYPLQYTTLPPAVRAHVNAATGYWGRHIKSVFRDSGGNLCQEVGRANAVTMAEQDKVFGLIMRGNEGPEVPMSLVMAQHHRVFIGRQNISPLWLAQRSPYFFDGMWGNGTDEQVALGSWICRDWVNKNATNTGDALVSGHPRKFGMLLPDLPDFHSLADVLQAELNKCHLQPKQYAYPFDLQTLEQQANTVVQRMHQDGVTSVLMVTDFFSPLMINQAATSQQWHPEWLRSGFGEGGYGAEYRTPYDTPDQATNTWIAADDASIDAPAFINTEAYKAWETIMPNTTPDGDWPSYYYQFKTLALGMAGAGRDLTPTTFAQGLQQLCGPCPRSDPLLPLEQYYPGHPTNYYGFTLVRFDPNVPDPTSPPDNTGAAPKGYFDFLEKGKRYGLRITDTTTG